MVTYPSQFREKARKLRIQGLTYREIWVQLGKFVPKGTLSSWVSDITLPPSYNSKVLKSHRE
ncbi:MAG: hypothetical protein UY18_C0049G0008, partial [Microgenomates group bacterium GW2011_GWF2_47_9]